MQQGDHTKQVLSAGVAEKVCRDKGPIYLEATGIGRGHTTITDRYIAYVMIPLWAVCIAVAHSEVGTTVSKAPSHAKPTLERFVAIGFDRPS